MSTNPEPLAECELHWLFNCAVCNHPLKLKRRRNYTEPSAVGTTKAEVLHDVATSLGLAPPTLTTSGETVEFWARVLGTLGLGCADTPAESAELVTLLADTAWDDACATSPYHVTLRGLLKVRDAVVALHREHRTRESTK